MARKRARDARLPVHIPKMPPVRDNDWDAPVKKPRRFILIPWEFWMKAPELGANALAVYACYCAHRNNESGEAWPEQATVSQETGLPIKAVRKAIKDLMPHWLLKVKKTGRADVYYVRVGLSDRSKTTQQTGQKRPTNYTKELDPIDLLNVDRWGRPSIQN